MENLIYSTNSNEATLKDFGPFKILISDLGIKGQKTFVYQTASKPLKGGQEIKIDNEIIKTAIQKADIIK